MTVAVGDVVTIAMKWGSQTRYKCLACTKFFSGGTTCKHCGATYEPVSDTEHKVTSVP